jgi:hypothetical protein
MSLTNLITTGYNKTSNALSSYFLGSDLRKKIMQDESFIREHVLNDNHDLYSESKIIRAGILTSNIICNVSDIFALYLTIENQDYSHLSSLALSEAIRNGLRSIVIFSLSYSETYRKEIKSAVYSQDYEGEEWKKGTDYKLSDDL